MKDNDEKGEKGLGAVEYLLTAHGSQLTGGEKLLNPRLWIADTGATAHASPSTVGMVNLAGVSETDGMIMGNGVSEKVLGVGQIPGVVCDKKCNKLKET